MSWKWIYSVRSYNRFEPTIKLQILVWKMKVKQCGIHFWNQSLTWNNLLTTETSHFLLKLESWENCQHSTANCWVYRKRRLWNTKNEPCIEENALKWLKKTLTSVVQFFKSLISKKGVFAICWNQNWERSHFAANAFLTFDW